MVEHKHKKKEAWTVPAESQMGIEGWLCECGAWAEAQYNLFTGQYKGQWVTDEPLPESLKGPNFPKHLNVKADKADEPAGSFKLNDASIFEVNNPNPVAEPRASVMNVQFPPTSFEEMKKNGPRVRLTVGAHEFLMRPALAEVLLEELRVAAALCRLAEKEHQTFLKNIATNFDAGSRFNAYED